MGLQIIIDIFRTPAIILGLVALIGLALQKKSPAQIFSGSVKTALGMIILSAGAGIIVTEILPFVDLFVHVFNLNGFATSSEAVVGAMQNSVVNIATTSSVIIGLGFIVNLILARFGKLKYIFLTGHMMWILSVAVAASLYAAGYSDVQIIIIGSIIQGFLMNIIPAIAQPLVRKLTGNDNFAIAHLTTLGTVVSGYVGGILGNKEKNAEDIKLPESLEFFKDTSMSISIVMGFFYLLVVILAGNEKVMEFSGGTNFIIYGIVKALGFTGGILILLQGIRMFLGELVPAFNGISAKLVPGAIPALDVPVLFAFGPNSLMIGFVCSVLGMIIGMGFSSMALGVVPLVSIIGAFFTGGVAGIYGNATGGRRGAAIAGLLYGFILIVGSALVFKIFDYSALGATGVGHDCTDVMGFIAIMQKPIIGMVIILAAYIILSITDGRFRKVKEEEVI